MNLFSKIILIMLKSKNKKIVKLLKIKLWTKIKKLANKINKII